MWNLLILTPLGGASGSGPPSPSSSSRSSPGITIARSNAYGSPLCLPRIIMAQITSLLNVENFPDKLVHTDGSPRLSPTFPYPDTTSKKTLKTENAGSSKSAIRLDSAIQIQKTPMKMYLLQWQSASVRRPLTVDGAGSVGIGNSQGYLP